MRLFLLPISTRRTLLYAYRPATSATSASPPTYAERITARAAKQWRKWEGYEKGWQRKVTGWGNAAFARISFQEWGLKSIPPLRSKDRRSQVGDEAAGTLAVRTPVQVVFPPHILKAERVPGLLHRLATERQGIHRKGMWWSVAGMPLTIPFGLIPVLPNLPFFYLAFRAWSHWKALRGSQHIEYLLDHDALVSSPSPLLQRVYGLRTLPGEALKALKKVTDPLEASDDFARREVEVLEFLQHQGSGSGGIESVPEPAPEPESLSKTTAIEDDTGPPERILLAPESGKLVADAIGVPGLDVEIERAVAQVSKSIEAERVKREEQEALQKSGAASEPGDWEDEAKEKKKQ